MKPSTQMVPAWDLLPQTLSWKDKVAWLAAEFSVIPQADTPVEHVLNEHTYERIMHIPGGTLFIGRTHKIGHHVELLEGEVILIAPNGKQDIVAPFAITTEPGFNAVCFAVTDCVAMTRHPRPDGACDVEALEEAIFEPAQALIDRGLALKQRYLS